MERSFRAGDVITFSGTATDAEDGTLPASAYTWNIDFLHEGHVHPGTPITGVTSGTFTIPTTGHDFSGFTRYRVSLTVTDSSGLQSTSSVTVFPQKVNLNFATAPAGATVFLDGIAHTAPFVYDTLIGFNHTIEAPNQTIGGNTYTFASWSDGGAQTHTIVVPAAAQTYTANFNVAATPAPPAFVQVNAATPQTNQSTVPVTYTSAQTAGNTNILAIGWNNATSNITSVTDSAGNIYQLAVPTARGTGVSQAIYYAKNIKAAAAGTNTVTVTFNTATPLRRHPRRWSTAAWIRSTRSTSAPRPQAPAPSANSGTVTTTARQRADLRRRHHHRRLLHGRHRTSPPASSPPPTPTSPKTASSPPPAAYSATAPCDSARLGHAGRHLQGRDRRRRGHHRTHGGHHRAHRNASPAPSPSPPPPPTMSAWPACSSWLDNNPMAAEDTTSPYSIT